MYKNIIKVMINEKKQEPGEQVYDIYELGIL